MNKWFLIGGIALIALFGGVKVAQARGERNNNPGNIRHGDKWQGMAPTQTDKSFVQFVSPEYGIRALAKILKNYQERHKLKTIAEIINRWAPPSENDTSSYIAAVSAKLNIDPHAVINVNDYLPELTKAIIKHENGYQPYSDEVIKRGIALS